MIRALSATMVATIKKLMEVKQMSYKYEGGCTKGGTVKGGAPIPGTLGKGGWGK